MSALSWLSELLGIGSYQSMTIYPASDRSYAVNPATGLSMIGGVGGIDTAGNRWGSAFASNDLLTAAPDSFSINPANGLPMIGGIGGVDVGGNTYGHDHMQESHFSAGLHDHQAHTAWLDDSRDHFSLTGFEDHWSSGTSIGFDDSWHSGSGGGICDW